MPALCRTRSLVCEWKKHTSVVTTGPAETSTFPARWLVRLICALSPVSVDFLVTVTREIITSRA